MAKYLFVNRFFHPDTSATSQLLSDLAFSLAARGDEVLVVTGRHRYCGSAALLPAREIVRGVHVQRVCTTNFGRARLLGRAFDYASFYVAVAIALVRNLRGDHVVVAKTDPPMLSVVVALVAWLRGAPLVNWLQDLFPEVGLRLGVPGLHRGARTLVWLRDRSLHMAKLNVVLGERMRAALLELGVPESRIAVLPNWAERSLVPVAKESNSLREAWGFAAEQFVVGYSGNMGRAHDIETIVEAAIRLRDDERVRFLFIGDGAKRRLVASAIAVHGLTNIVLRDYQPAEELALSLSVPDVHLVSLLPELEGLIVPSKLYGALAVARAVVNVGDPQGEVARILASCGAGVSCAAGDVAGLVDAIARLAGTAETTAMGEAGREWFALHAHADIALRRWQRTLAAIDADRADVDSGTPLPLGAALPRR